MPIIDPQDLLRERDELRAENERLREVEIKSLEAECVAHIETIERLQTANAMLAEERDAWRRAFHRAHEVRGVSLKACPLCAWA